jgi:hypothetical protein
VLYSLLELERERLSHGTPLYTETSCVRNVAFSTASSAMNSRHRFLPSRHRFFLVFLGPRANAGMVPVFPFQVATTCCSHVALPQLNLE